MSDVEKVLFGACAGITGLGLQTFLSNSHQVPLERYKLIFIGLIIPLVYYAIKLEFWCFKRIFELLKEKSNKELRKR